MSRRWYVILILALFNLIHQATSYNVRYQDCSNPETISEVNLHQACAKPEGQSPEKKKYTIIQRRTHEKAKGYSCRVTRSSLVMYCGAYSHQKFAEPPKIEIPVDVSSHECLSMVENKRYISHYGTTHTVEIGETIFTVSEKGVIKAENGNVYCEGEQMRIGEEVVDGVLVLSQYRVTVIKEDYIIDNNIVEVVGDHISLPEICKPEKGQCELPGRVYIWTYIQRCQYVKIREVMLQAEHGMLLDHENKLLFTKEDRAKLGHPCPVGDIYFTEYTNLFLTHESEFDMINELDISLYIRTRNNYMNYQMEERTRQNNEMSRTSECLTRINIVGDEIRPLYGAFGFYTKRVGEILLVFQCQAKTAKVAEDLKKCYKHLPVIIDGRLQFVTATGILVRDGIDVPCATDAFAPAYKTIEDRWITVNPTVPLRKPPKNSSLVGYDQTTHESLAGGGLYTEEELTKWQSQIFWSTFKEATVEHISQGICKFGQCHAASTIFDDVPALDLNMITNKVTELEMGWWTTIKKIINDNLVIISLFIIAKFIFSTLITIGLMIYTITISGFKTAGEFMFKTILPDIYRLRRSHRRNHRNHPPTVNYETVEVVREETAA